MAQVLRVDTEGKPFNSMKIFVCKSDGEAEEIFSQKKERLLKPEVQADNAVWGEAPGAKDAFAHTFVGRKENLVYEIVLYEGAEPSSREDLTRMHQMYLEHRRELDSLVARIMKF